MVIKVICGVGINDADYSLSKKEYTGEYYPSGVEKRRNVWRCPFYTKWADMLMRCYSKKYQDKHTTYRGCYVSEGWLYFSNFKSWMITQDWEGKQLDKDLLFKGNKIYSTETCVFVDRKVNNFITDQVSSRGNYMIGCYWHKRGKKFQAYCNNPFTRKLENVGMFSSELEAHLAWKKRKHKYACQLADSIYVTECRVAEALLSRYSPEVRCDKD